MNRETFSRHLWDAAVHARDLAREYILEPLPDDLVFRVRLNSSYDGNPLHEDEVVYPEDSHDVAKAMSLSQVSTKEAVNALYRDGRVPEWVNASAIAETGEATLIELEACGRYTDNDDLLYHHQEGRPPFHVLSPALPIGHQAGARFSIYNRAESDRAALLRVEPAQK